MRVGVTRALADSSDLRLLGEQSSKKWENPALDADEFILGGEIRNRTTNTQTNSKRYIHPLPIGKRG